MEDVKKMKVLSPLIYFTLCLGGLAHEYKGSRGTSETSLEKYGTERLIEHVESRPKPLSSSRQDAYPWRAAGQYSDITDTLSLQQEE